MKLPWQKEEKSQVRPVKGRAAVVPKSYKFHVAKNVTENNFTVNSYSTVITTVKVLKDGETAADVNSWLPGTVNIGADRISVAEAEAQGLQRIQFNAPNWIGMILSSDGSYYVEHVEIPVWIDPATGKVVEVDVPELVANYEHRREELSRYWGRTEGPFSDFFDIVDAPKNLLKLGKFFASLPGEWIGAIKDLKEDLTKEPAPWQPIPEEEMPDMSLYPPVDGIDFDRVIYLSVNMKEYKELLKTQPEVAQTMLVWSKRVQDDVKLREFFFNEMERLKRGIAGPTS